MFFLFLFALTSSMIFPKKPNIDELIAKKKKRMKELGIEDFEDEKNLDKTNNETQTKEDRFFNILEEAQEYQEEKMKNGTLDNPKFISKKHEIVKNKKGKRPKISLTNNKLFKANVTMQMNWTEPVVKRAENVVVPTRQPDLDREKDRWNQKSKI